MNEVFELFPTPFMRCPAVIDGESIRGLQASLSAGVLQSNPQSNQLAHTQIIKPSDAPELATLATRILPSVAELGQLMFGEALDWRIKEMWINVLQHGGRQAIHNHTNSFISGVIYLTESHPSAYTVFAKGLGGRDFVFSNTNARSQGQLGPFNADKWIAPEPSVGDMILFPSYLLHEVPVNQGSVRVSLAFNAIPKRLDAWGYEISFD